MRLLLCLALLGCSQNDKPSPAKEVVAVERPPPAADAAPKPGISQRLYAEDVAADTLPLSIAIETIGGVSTVLIPRGTKLPISRTEVFSTALDNQASVEVSILQGERPLAKDNRLLGKFQLGGIPPAPRGIPQIEVVFAVLENGLLEVSARDKATGETREIRIDGATAVLDKAAVDKILADTAAAKSIDDQYAVWSQARLKLENQVYAGKRLLAQVADKLSPAMKKRWTDELARAEVLLAATTEPGGAPFLLTQASAALEKALHAGSEELYRNAK
jgi:molecular chaperone DnaK